jgi:hypothetical protein
LKMEKLTQLFLNYQLDDSNVESHSSNNKIIEEPNPKPILLTRNNQEHFQPLPFQMSENQIEVDDENVEIDRMTYRT